MTDAVKKMRDLAGEWRENVAAPTPPIGGKGKPHEDKSNA